MGHGHNPLEVVETVLEVADVAWNAVERHNKRNALSPVHQNCMVLEKELVSEREENQRLKAKLDENLKLLQQLSQSLTVSKDCPADLFVRLVATVDSSSFLTELDSLHQASIAGSCDSLPFKKVEGSDLHLDYLVNACPEEPSWWVWVTDEIIPYGDEELSEIDGENYVIISEEHVVDGVANFIARCILSNPKSKSLTPGELKKIVSKALDEMKSWEKMKSIWHAGKLIYSLSTWGLALAGLYRHRAVLRVVAKGIGASGKVVMKAL